MSLFATRALATRPCAALAGRALATRPFSALASFDSFDSEYENGLGEHAQTVGCTSSVLPNGVTVISTGAAASVVVGVKLGGLGSLSSAASAAFAAKSMAFKSAGGCSDLKVQRTLEMLGVTPRARLRLSLPRGGGLNSRRCQKKLSRFLNFTTRFLARLVCLVCRARAIAWVALLKMRARFPHSVRVRRRQKDALCFACVGSAW